MHRLVEAWRTAWRSGPYRIQFFVTVVIVAGALVALLQYLAFNESRTGSQLYDTLLAMFEPHNVTWMTFALIYGAGLLAFFFLIHHPHQILVAARAFAFMSLIRIVVMYLLPLEPPAGTIILRDPIAELLGTGETLRRDLFFSGHTATLFLLFLSARTRAVRLMFLAATILVAFLVLLQHVHYTIDVIAAFFFSYAAYRMAKLSMQNVLHDGSEH